MARARNIKPGFFINEDLVELPFETRLLFIGLWTLADREGRLEDRPKRIKMDVFPADSVDVESMLNDLAKYQFIIRYEADGSRYIQIPAFSKHQNPHKNERQSTIPAPCLNGANYENSPEKSCASTVQEHENDSENPVQAQCKHGVTRADSLNPDSLNPDSLKFFGASPPSQTSEPEKPDKPKKQKSEKTGTRLPDDWVLPNAWGIWAMSNSPLTEYDVRQEAEKFRDYWHSVAGQRGRKADWYASWRNWIRKAMENRKSPQNRNGSGRDTVAGLTGGTA